METDLRFISLTGRNGESAWVVGNPTCLKHLLQWAAFGEHFVNVLLLFLLAQDVKCHLQELGPHAEGPESI